MNSRFVTLATVAAALVVLSGCGGIDRRQDRREDRRDDRQDRREDRRDLVSQAPSGAAFLGKIESGAAA